MSSAQDDKERLLRIYKKSLNMTAFIVLPSMVGLVIIAEPFVRVFLTEKWLPSVFIIQWLALSRMIVPLGAINANLLNSIGRSDLYLKIDLIKLPLTILGLLISSPFGLQYMVISNFIVAIFYYFINAYYPGKIFNFGPISQLLNMFPIIVSTSVMFVATYFWSINNGLLDIIIKIVVGAIVYIISCFVLKVESVQEIWSYMLGKIKGKNRRSTCG